MKSTQAPAMVVASALALISAAGATPLDDAEDQAARVVEKWGDGLKELGDFTNPSHLNLSNTQVIDKGLKALKACKKLEFLYLQLTKMADPRESLIHTTNRHSQTPVLVHLSRFTPLGVKKH